MTDFTHETSILCSAWDFYSYNYQGPSSRFSGERSHFFINVKEAGKLKIVIKTPTAEPEDAPYAPNDFRKDEEPAKLTFDPTSQKPMVIICNPAGRVMFKKKYNPNGITIDATPGKWLLKIWSKNIHNYYKVCVHHNELNSFTIVQDIYSPASSNSDGSLFEKGNKISRSNTCTNTYERGHQIAMKK